MFDRFLNTLQQFIFTQINEVSFFINHHHEDLVKKKTTTDTY